MQYRIAIDSLIQIEQQTKRNKPEEVVERIDGLIQQALADREIANRLASVGMESAYVGQRRSGSHYTPRTLTEPIAPFEQIDTFGCAPLHKQSLS